jgi:YgiT-type zinc finger domain-containing protein
MTKPLETKERVVAARCEICGAAGLRTELVNRDYGQFVVQNIPEYHCDVCGRAYYDYDTLMALDEARDHPERYARQTVSFAALAPARLAA